MFENLNSTNLIFIAIILVVAVVLFLNTSTIKETLANLDTSASIMDNENTVMITGDDYKDVNSEESDTTESDGELTKMKLNIIPQKPVIKYFGCHQCPHSCQDSDIYKFLTKKFSRKFPDIKIDVHWNSEKSSEDQFRKYNIEYVPAIFNGNGKAMDVDVNNINTKLLEREVMKTILQQLN